MAIVIPNAPPTRRLPRLGRAALVAVLGIWAAAFAQPSLLTVVEERSPRVTVSWPTPTGTVQIEGDRRYTSSAQKTPLGHNLECYVMVGGTRQGKGQTHHDSTGIVVGLYKIDTKKPLFEGISDDAAVTISLSGIVLNRAAVPRPKTAMMHLRYMLEDLKACGLTSNARNLFNLADPEDVLKDLTNGGSARPGVLDGKGADHGSVESKVEPDGSISFTFKFPYALLRHIEDPYKRTNPGGFFEPNHFHVEMEMMGKEQAEKEDAAPKTGPVVPISNKPPSQSPVPQPK